MSELLEVPEKIANSSGDVAEEGLDQTAGLDTEGKETEDPIERENRQLEQNIALLQALVDAAKNLDPKQVKETLEAY